MFLTLILGAGRTNSPGFGAVFRTDVKYTVVTLCHVSFVDLTYELTLKSFELTGKSSSPLRSFLFSP